MPLSDEVKNRLIVELTLKLVGHSPRRLASSPQAVAKEVFARIKALEEQEQIVSHADTLAKLDDTLQLVHRCRRNRDFKGAAFVIGLLMVFILKNAGINKHQMVLSLRFAGCKPEMLEKLNDEDCGKIIAMFEDARAAIIKESEEREEKVPA